MPIWSLSTVSQTPGLESVGRSRRVESDAESDAESDVESDTVESEAHAAEVYHDLPIMNKYPASRSRVNERSICWAAY